MGFRECINCHYLSCTVFKRCILVAESIVKNTPETPLFPPLPPPPVDDRDQPPEPHCNDRFSNNGLCPCCGVEVERNRFENDRGAFMDECFSCGWESDLIYDM